MESNSATKYFLTRKSINNAPATNSGFMGHHLFKLADQYKKEAEKDAENMLNKLGHNVSKKKSRGNAPGIIPKYDSVAINRSFFNRQNLVLVAGVAAFLGSAYLASK